MSGEAPGDIISPNCAVLDVHVGELRQLFNAMDPAPFRERDLDPRAEEYIVEWSREVRLDQPLALLVHLDRKAGTRDEERVLREAIHAFFADHAISARRRLRQLLRVGRKSLLISVVFLGSAIALGDLVGGLFERDYYGGLAQEGLLIGGWVAMWRPLEIFLYDWWPIRAEARLYDRLSNMFVHVVDANTGRE